MLFNTAWSTALCTATIMQHYYLNCIAIWPALQTALNYGSTLFEVTI